MSFLLVIRLSEYYDEGEPILKCVYAMVEKRFETRLNGEATLSDCYYVSNIFVVSGITWDLKLNFMNFT